MSRYTIRPGATSLLTRPRSTSVSPLRLARGIQEGMAPISSSSLQGGEGDLGGINVHVLSAPFGIATWHEHREGGNMAETSDHLECAGIAFGPGLDAICAAAFDFTRNEPPSPSY